MSRCKGRNDRSYNREYGSCRYMDCEMYEMEQEYGSCSVSSIENSPSGKTIAIVLLAAFLMACIHELLGAAVLFGYLYYETFLK